MNLTNANPAPEGPAARPSDRTSGSRVTHESARPPGAQLELSDVTVEPALLDGFGWERVFPGRGDRPIELEIGTGKARFLLHRARAMQQHCFLGIEWANEFYRFAADRMARWGVRNVRMLRTDAGVFVRTVCPRRSLTALHIYHPDPWPKARHHKRRLFQPAFVSAAAECLVDGGRMFVQTDHAEYFTIIAGLLRNHPDLAAVPFEPDLAERPGAAAIGTNFEEKYIREGRSIHRIAVERRPRL